VVWGHPRVSNRLPTASIIGLIAATRPFGTRREVAPAVAIQAAAVCVPDVVNTGHVASVLWFLVALWLTVYSVLAGDTTQALLWAVVAAIAVVWAVGMRDVSGPARV
jgi:hypothetical protein